MSSNITLIESSKRSPKMKFKSYISMTVLVLIVLLFIYMLGRIGPDFFAMLIFLLILSFPVLVLLRHKLVGFLPKTISDNLLEIDSDLDESKTRKFSISLYTKQSGMYIIVAALCIQSIVLLNNAKKNIPQKDSIYKILGSAVSLIIAGIITLEVANPMVYNSSSVNQNYSSSLDNPNPNSNNSNNSNSDSPK